MKFGYTMIRWSNFFDDSFSAEKWICIKIPVSTIAGSMLYILFNFSPNSVGLWSLIDTSIMQFSSVKFAIGFFIVLLSVLYLLEIQMLWTTILLFITSIFVFSIKESYGIMGRAGVESLVLLAQGIAYLFKRFDKDSDLNGNRIQFSLQFIAAMYTLAAISKWCDSGLNWVIDSPKIALQIQKSFYYEFVTSGNVAFHNKGIFIADLITHHPLIIQITMAFVLIIETSACLMLINRKWAFYYGLLLLAMHIGIIYTMNISSFMSPLVIFCFNPLFMLYALINNFAFFSKGINLSRKTD